MPTITQSPNKKLIRSTVFKTEETYYGKPLYMVSLSGLAELGTRAKGKSGAWINYTLKIQLDIPIKRMGLPAKPANGYYLPRFWLKHWTVFAGLNGIRNENTAYYPGYRVNSFKLLDPVNLSERATIQVEIAARDSDGYVDKVGFQLDLLMAFRSYRKIVIG